MALTQWLALLSICRGYKIGIVTMHDEAVMSYANMTSLANQRYADRHGYGFHALNHTIDTLRVPHWTKIYAMLIHMADYDFVFWIDADAMFYEQSLRLEEVLQVDEHPEAQIWAQDIWPDYPSIHRKELMDGATVLLRNSLWTRQFLVEMYHYPPCLDVLNFTEQWCLTLAYEGDLMGMRSKTVILPTPRINHHRLPGRYENRSLFILHLAGRSTKARARHFKVIHEQGEQMFQEPRYGSFWDFHQLFARHDFGKLANMQLCLFGIADGHQAMMEAMMFYFPYHSGFAVVQEGAPGLYTQLTRSEKIAEKFGSRMAMLNILEYQAGRDRQGEKMVEGFFCDLLVVSVESWRHLPQGIHTLTPLVRAGMTGFQGERGRGFGFSTMKDVFFVLLHEPCERKVGGQLDKDDEDGQALIHACRFMEDLQEFLSDLHAGVDANGIPDERYFVMPDNSMVPWEQVSQPHVERGGSATLARLPRAAF
ncbi:unnamed protein product [Effrenium voratum]|nr:unnamed protein product [Effrenium voratum]